MNVYWFPFNRAKRIPRARWKIRRISRAASLRCHWFLPPVCSQITFTVQLASRVRGGGVEVFLRGPLDPLVRIERYLHNGPEAEAWVTERLIAFEAARLPANPSCVTRSAPVLVSMCLLNEGWENTDSPGSAFTAGLSWQRSSRSSFYSRRYPVTRRRERLHLCETTAASCSARFSSKRETDWSKY